jgi:hypothetical protein
VKKYLALLLSGVFILSLVTCGNSSEENVPSEITSGTDMTNENTGETRVTLMIEDVVIPATLNNTVTAQAFIERLPLTVRASKAQYDFCGTVEELACDDSERQAGWKNGDIGYSNGWFALFHNGEDQSASYTSEMIIGHFDDEYLETIRGLSGRIEITIALADE